MLKRKNSLAKATSSIKVPIIKSPSLMVPMRRSLQAQGLKQRKSLRIAMSISNIMRKHKRLSLKSVPQRENRQLMLRMN